MRGIRPELLVVVVVVILIVIGRSVLVREEPPPNPMEGERDFTESGLREVPSRVRAAEGFSIGLYATGLRNARLLRFTPAGDLLVSQSRDGRISLLEGDADGDGRSDGVRALLEGLNLPHGLDLHEGWLYVAETDAVGRIRYDAETATTHGSFERVVEGIPGWGDHWTRTLRFGPDGWMYLSIGSSCDVCRDADPRRAALVRYRPDGTGEEIFASGLRNSVGFDWRPGVDELYATENGREWLGRDRPPCELNRLVRGGFYGFPYANGDNVPDPDYGEGNEERIATAIPPAHAFGAHNAPLGITFLRGEGLLPAYRGAALVALHGSARPTDKVGHKVVSLHWQDDGSIEERDFVVGFEVDDDVIGRPVDVAEGPDGAIYVSDDRIGAVYRVTLGGSGGVMSSAAPHSDPAAPARAAAASVPLDTAAVTRGRTLYDDRGCAECHGPGLAPAGEAPLLLRELAGRYSVDELAAYLAAPAPPMPSTRLGPEQRRDLASWLLQAHP